MADPRDDSPVLPTQHFRLAMRTMNAPAELVERLLKGTGLKPRDMENPHFQMPVGAIWPLCDNVAELFGEGWFLNYPVLWGPDILSELGMAMRVAPDFGTAIDVVTEFAHIRWPIARLSRSEDPSNIIVTLRPLIPPSPQNWRLAMSIAALSFQAIAKSVLTQGSETIRYQLEGAPPAYAERLSTLFDGNVSWGHGRAAIIVPRPLCVQGSSLASNAPFTALLGALRKLAAEQAQKNAGIAAKVTLTLDSMTRGRIDAAEVARKIGLSKRTLERRLLEAGTSFRELSNQSHRKRLEHLLLDPRLTTDAIAERMGYHDASSLMRASRRLYGVSLSHLRREVRGRRQR